MRWTDFVRRARPAQARTGLDWGQWIEALLLLLLLIQIARLLWALVTPVGPLGEWRAREPVLVGSDARRALFAGFDPFFRNGAAAGGAVQQVTVLPLKLYGVSLNEASGRGSAIIADENDVQASYAVGEEIAPGVVLKAVAFDHVVIERGGMEETLFIDQSSGGVAQGGEQAGENASKSPTGAMNAAALASALSLVPRMENGKVTGIVIGEQGGGGLFAQAGFRPGDIIVQIDGEPVTSAADLNQLREAIVPGAGISLMVERGAATVPISLILPENR